MQICLGSNHPSKKANVANHSICIDQQLAIQIDTGAISDIKTHTLLDKKQS